MLDRHCIGGGYSKGLVRYRLQQHRPEGAGGSDKTSLSPDSRCESAPTKPDGKPANFLIEVSSVMTRTSRLRCDKSPPADSKLRAGALIMRRSHAKQLKC